MDSIFVAYPSRESLSGPIEDALTDIRSHDAEAEIDSWQSKNIAGSFIADGIFEKIDRSDVLVADITCLNFNVTFEIGYAIAKGKQVIPVINSALSPQIKEIEQLGVYDTLRYKKYENSHELSGIIKDNRYRSSVDTQIMIDQDAPVYLLESFHKTNDSINIESRLAKTGYLFRSFDPTEEPRLSLIYAFRQVASSAAVVIPLLSAESSDNWMHNLRGALLAGLAIGMSRETLILQRGNDPVPLDYRDLVKHYNNASDIGKNISDLAPKIAEAIHEARGRPITRQGGLLANLDLGQPAAENEVSSLGQYYMPSGEYSAVVRGGIRLVVGRKGTGKTALFYQVRDDLKNKKKILVLDLKPQAYQLKQFRELILATLDGAIKEHIATAFWEYVLLLEICYRILDYDKDQHILDHTIFDNYQKLANKYEADKFMGESDFSGRLLYLVNRIKDDLLKLSASMLSKPITSEHVTEIVYTHDIVALLTDVSNYLCNHRDVVILFDNLDKGWPTHGIQDDDLIILHALLEATRKLERSLSKKTVKCVAVTFIRNDVYELLVDTTSDRGKESRVSLDWSDPTILKEMLRLRIIANDGIDESLSIDDCCRLICTSHVKGEKAIDYIIERSLMRPRNLITIANHARVQAVNLRHETIQADDIEYALEIYAADLARELDLEIRDVFPQAEDIIYCFIGAQSRLRITEIWKIFFSESKLNDDQYEHAIEILLWFGFLGVECDKDEIVYIYDVHYDMKRLRKLASNLSSDTVYFCIQKAFWPFLGIQVE